MTEPQVEQASQKVSEALKRTLDEIEAKRESRIGWFQRLFGSKATAAALPQSENISPQTNRGLSKEASHE